MADVALEPAVEVHYQVPGPTVARFHASQARHRGIMGPIGSGKTVACCMDLFRWACEQEPYKGTRHTRFAIIRNTYPELRSTTIKTWQEWFPPEICPIVFGAPITGLLQIPLKDGTWVRMETVFIALDRPEHVGKLKSLELTGFYINEASEVHKAIFDMADGRVQRYPPPRWGGPTRVGSVMDTNAMEDDHWWYRFAEEEKPHGFKFFRQPPAILEDPTPTGIGYKFNPECENAQNLGADYWMNQIPGKAREWIRVYLQSEYGTVAPGRSVYPEFSDFMHVQPVTVMEGLPLLLGWDFGRTPACVIEQISPAGQLRTLHELVTDDPLDLNQTQPKMGVRDFANDVVRPFMKNHYDGARFDSVGDPAGTTPESDERTCMMYLKDAGFPTKAARTNNFTPRREAVAMFLTRMVEGQPGYVLDPKCRILRKGFNGRYKYRKMQIPDEDLYQEQPIKNAYSHPHDAKQYIALECMTDEERKRADDMRKRSQKRRRANRHSWRV